MSSKMSYDLHFITYVRLSKENFQQMNANYIMPIILQDDRQR